MCRGPRQRYVGDVRAFIAGSQRMKASSRQNVTAMREAGTGRREESTKAQKCARMVPGARYIWVQDRALHDFAGGCVKMRSLFNKKP